MCARARACTCVSAHASTVVRARVTAQDLLRSLILTPDVVLDAAVFDAYYQMTGSVACRGLH